MRIILKPDARFAASHALRGSLMGVRGQAARAA